MHPPHRAKTKERPGQRHVVVVCFLQTMEELLRKCEHPYLAQQSGRPTHIRRRVEKMNLCKYLATTYWGAGGEGSTALLLVSKISETFKFPFQMTTPKHT